MSILDAIGSSKMDPSRARAYLYDLQLAMQNLGKDRDLIARDSVSNPICLNGDGEFLAPEEECEPAGLCATKSAALDSPASEKLLPANLPGNEILNISTESSPSRTALESPSLNVSIDPAPKETALNAPIEPALKGTGFSPYINIEKMYWASAPDGAFESADDQTFDVSNTNAPDIAALEDTSPAVKGTGFSPYINPQNNSGASAPEGISESAGDQTIEVSSTNAPDIAALEDKSSAVKGTGFSPYINSQNNFGASAPEGAFESAGDQTFDIFDTNAPDIAALENKSSAVKGTGFRPYIHTEKTNGASAPEGISESAGDQTIDISAAAEEPTQLARYSANPWAFTDPELTEDELQKRRSFNRIVLNIMRGVHAANPFQTPAERHRLLEQTRADYFNRFLRPQPEPRESPPPPNTPPLCSHSHKDKPIFLARHSRPTLK